MLVHVITKEDQEVENSQKLEMLHEFDEGILLLLLLLLLLKLLWLWKSMF